MGPVAFDQRLIVSKIHLDQSAFVVVISIVILCIDADLWLPQ